MAIQQGGGSYEYRPYRAPATVKALEARAKAAAEAAAAAQQMQQPISDPWQGAAHLGNILAGGVNQARADQQAASARDELARIRAGINMDTGATAEQLAAISALDPEFANAEYERAMRARQEDLSREDTQSFQAGESELDRNARIAEQEKLFGQQTTLQEDTQRHAEATAATLAQTQEEKAKADAIREGKKAALGAALDEEEGKIAALLEGGFIDETEATRRRDQVNRAREAEIEKNKPETITGVPPEVAAARGGDIAKNPQNYSYNSKTQEVTPVEKARSSQDIKATGEFEKGLIETRSTLGNLQKALDLAPNVYESGLVDANTWAKGVLASKDYKDWSPEDIQKATATQQYFNIMNEQAITSMSNTLSGATSGFEMQEFVKIMSDPRTPLATKQQKLNDMIAKVKAYEQSQMAQVSESGGNIGAGANQGGGSVDSGKAADDDSKY